MTQVFPVKNDIRNDGKRVLFAFLAFFFIFSSVNAFFVYKAISTSPGVVSENTYEIGLNYNNIIAEAKKRKLEQDGQTDATPSQDTSHLK